MTGYGRGDCSQDGFKITVELSSVNRKQSEMSVNLPRELEMLEAQIRDVINKFISRGRLTVRVSLHTGTGNLSAKMHLNVPLVVLDTIGGHLRSADVAKVAAVTQALSHLT